MIGGANIELTVFEKLQLETKKKILEYKTACDANIVSILYKRPEYFDEIELTRDNFSRNCWKVYFEIAKCLYRDESKKILDEVTVGLYVEKHPKLKEVYLEFGGYEIINESGKYVKEANFEGYLMEQQKWNTVSQLVDKGFPIYDRLSDFADMSSEDIYNEFEALLNSICGNSMIDYSSHDISDNIYGLIDKLNDGEAIGMPYCNMPILTQETSGQLCGTVTLIGGLSNVGKSSFLRNAVIPTAIKNKERIIIMLNEESYTRWQRELMVYVANNILKRELQKKTVKRGRFEVDKLEVLKESAQWIIDNTKNKLITIINFKQYKTSRVLKVIRKYSALGVKYFALDTFKLDSGNTTSNSWVDMSQNMVEIYDLVKEENKNVHISVTFQLSKSSTRQRYYMIDNIGLAKNIVDTASVCIMIRKVFEDEYSGENKELDIRDLKGEKVFLEKNKNYQIVFLVKNRDGRANEYQIVIEHDLSRNILKEVGVVNVPLDF